MIIAEVATVIGVAVLSVTSIGGWIYTIRKNGRSEGRLQEQVNSLTKAVSRLPCQENADFLQKMGGVATAIENLEGWVKTVEQAQIDTNRRIDKIVNNRGKD